MSSIRPRADGAMPDMTSAAKPVVFPGAASVAATDPAAEVVRG